MMRAWPMPRCSRLGRGGGGAWPSPAGVEAQAGDLKRARDWLVKALKQLPRNADVAFNLGELDLAEQRPEAAEQHFRRTVALDPNHGDAAFGLGRSLMLMKRHEEAIPWLKR